MWCLIIKTFIMKNISKYLSHLIGKCFKFLILQIVESDRKFNHLVAFLRKHKDQKHMVFFSTCASVDYFSKALMRWACFHTDLANTCIIFEYFMCWFSDMYGRTRNYNWTYNLCSFEPQRLLHWMQRCLICHCL